MPLGKRGDDQKLLELPKRDVAGSRWRFPSEVTRQISGDRRRPSLTFPRFLESGAQELLLVLGTDNGIFSNGQYLLQTGCRQLEQEPLLKKDWGAPINRLVLRPL